MDIKLSSLAESGLGMHQLIRDYWTADVQGGMPPLKMDWSYYGDLEKLGRLVIITAREDYDLLGFAMYLLSNHPQHGGMPIAFCNTLAVDTKHRGKGIGRQLVQAAEAYLRGTDVKMMFHGYRTVYDAEPLFPKLGFDLIEHIYMKVL